jgi:hypothetical protein
VQRWMHRLPLQHSNFSWGFGRELCPYRVILLATGRSALPRQKHGDARWGEKYPEAPRKTTHPDVKQPTEFRAEARRSAEAGGEREAHSSASAKPTQPTYAQQVTRRDEDATRLIQREPRRQRRGSSSIGDTADTTVGCGGSLSRRTSHLSPAPWVETSPRSERHWTLPQRKRYITGCSAGPGRSMPRCHR